MNNRHHHLTFAHSNQLGGGFIIFLKKQKRPRSQCDFSHKHIQYLCNSKCTSLKANPKKKV